MNVPSDSLDVIDRVLTERADELASEVASRVGMTWDDAERFVDEAGPHLIESVRWQVVALSIQEMRAPQAMRDLLEGISGSAVAARLGLSTRRAWAGLRVLVPAVVETAAESVDADGSTTPPPTQGNGSTTPPPTWGNGSASRGRMRFDVGFGLSFEIEGGDHHDGNGGSGPPPAQAFGHPIFTDLS